VAGVPPAAGQTEASCLVRISFDPVHFPLNHRLISEIVHSSGVLNAAVREVLDEEIDLSDVFVDVAFQPAGGHDKLQDAVMGHPPSPTQPRVLIGKLAVTMEELSDAEHLLGEICERLVDELNETTEREREQLKARLDRAKDVYETAQHHLKEIHEVQQELREEAGRTELSPQAVEAELRRVEVQYRDMTAEFLAHDARRYAIIEQIAQIAKEVKAQADSDPVLQELQKVVEARAKQLQYVRTLEEAGQASTGDVARAHQEFAEMKARVAERREAQSERAGGSLLTQLRHELTEMSVDFAESEAMVGVIQSELQRLKEAGVLELADRYERDVELRIRPARAAVEEAARAVHELERQAGQLTPPLVSVIGGVERKH
jgi:hypothetical protein